MIHHGAGIKRIPGDRFGVWQIPRRHYGKKLLVFGDCAGITPLILIRWLSRHGSA